MCKILSVILMCVLLTTLTHITVAFYIRNEATQAPTGVHIDDETLKKGWNMFKKKLQSNDEQKQSISLDKILQMINKQNARTTIKPTVKPRRTQISQSAQEFFNDLLVLAKKELKQNSLKKLNRSRRRVSVQMISDMPVDKIDELLKMFKTENEVDTTFSQAENDEDEIPNYYDEPEYLTKNNDSNDYVYENLYEDESDITLPKRSQHNSEFGSFQDLIFQATENEMQREKEETKLRSISNEHFV